MKTQVSVRGASVPSTSDGCFLISFGGREFQKIDGQWVSTDGVYATPEESIICDQALAEERARALPVKGWVCTATRHLMTHNWTIPDRKAIFRAPDGSLWVDVEGNVMREPRAELWRGEAVPKGWNEFAWKPHHGRPSQTLLSAYARCDRG